MDKAIEIWFRCSFFTITVVFPTILAIDIKNKFHGIKQCDDAMLNDVKVRLLKTRKLYQEDKKNYKLADETNELIQSVKAYGKPLNENVCFRRVEDMINEKVELNTKYGPLIIKDYSAYPLIVDPVPIQRLRDPIDGKSEVPIDDLLADLEEQVKLRELTKFRALRRILNSM